MGLNCLYEIFIKKKKLILVVFYLFLVKKDFLVFDGRICNRKGLKGRLNGKGVI